MTCISALVIALSLILCDVTFLLQDSILEDKSAAASLVFLTTTAFLVREISVLPETRRRQFRGFVLVLETIVSFFLFELSMRYVWGHIQEYIRGNSDRMLSIISESPAVQELVCHLCCGRNNCSSVLADVLLKAISIAGLVAVCYFYVPV